MPSRLPQTASLLFHCPDSMGIVGDIGRFFADRDVIIKRQEALDSDGQCFLRVEWLLGQRWQKHQHFIDEFEPLAEQYQGVFEVSFFEQPRTMGLFVSEETHILIGVLARAEDEYFRDLQITFMVGDDPAMQAVADRYAIPFFCIAKDEDPISRERQQLDIIERYQPDLIGLAGYPHKLSVQMLSSMKCKVIAVQKSVLAMSGEVISGKSMLKYAHERGLKLLGATAYFVTPELKSGPIIRQGVSRVFGGADIKEMGRIAQNAEQDVFNKALLKVIDHKALIYKNRVVIFH